MEFSEVTFPAAYYWDTTTVTNDDHTITFRLEDNAGNFVVSDFTYTINNEPTPTPTPTPIPTPSPTPSETGGLNTLIALAIIGSSMILFVILRKRKAS